MTNVGIVLPVINGADYIAEAIDSVLEQTYEEFELVVVDGGSTDGTVTVVEAYDDPRIALVTNDSPTGLGAARNQGARQVNGDLIAFIDHDDRWHPEKLSRHVERHRTVGADLVYSDVRTIDSTGKVIGEAPRPDPEPAGERLVRQLLLNDQVVILTPSSVTLRRTAWEAVDGCDSELSVSEDADLHVRLAGTHSFERIAESLVERREHDANLSDDYRGMYRAHGRILEKALERYSFLDEDDADRRRARTAYHRATSAMLAGESDEAIEYGIETLRYERRVRPALVVTLGSVDRLSGPLRLGHRLMRVYERRFG